MTIHPEPVASVVILADGVAGYVAALMLMVKMPHLRGKVVVADVSGTSTDDNLLTLSSSSYEFHSMLGVSEIDFLRAAQANVNYGAIIKHGDSAAVQGFLSDAPYGFAISGVSFFHLFNRYLASSPDAKIEEFCLSYHLALGGKCKPRGQAEESLDAVVSCGYVVNEQRYKQFLTYLCQRFDIAVVAKNFDSVRLVDGKIAAVLLAGESLQGDLYCDCSDEGILGNYLKVGKESLFAIDVVEQRSTSITQTQIPQNHSTITIANNLLRQDSFAKGAQALRLFSIASQLAGGEDQCQASVRHAAWWGNCVFLGGAYAQLPGILVDNLHLVRSGILRLINFWPTSQFGQEMCNVFNRRSREEVECLADVDNFILHKAFPAQIALTEFNHHRLSLYRATGRVAMKERESLSMEFWQILFHSFGEVLQGGDMLANELPLASIQHELAKMKHYFSVNAARCINYTEFYH